MVTLVAVRGVLATIKHLDLNGAVLVVNVFTLGTVMVVGAVDSTMLVGPKELSVRWNGCLMVSGVRHVDDLSE